jgi:predicted dehydrogenase
LTQLNPSPLAIGLVGFGGAGDSQYLQFSSIPGCRVTAVFDPRERGRQRASLKAHGCFVTDDWAAFLGSEIDIVSVCSPDRSHADYIVRSLAAGKHVICEKPLTDSVDGIRRILRSSSDASNLVLAVQHQMRFVRLFERMKEVLARGELGTISYIEGYYVHNLVERASEFDTWRFEDEATPLVYSGCHFVDLLRWLLEDEAVEVMGMANHLAFPRYPESDCNVILLRFGSGTIGKVITAFGARRPQDHSVRILGSKACIDNNLLFREDGEWELLTRPAFDPSTSGLRQWRARLRTIAASRLLELGMRSAGGTGGYYGVANYPLRLYEHGLAVRRSLANAVDAIRGGPPPLCNATESARTVATCLAGVEAYRSGGSVRVADFWPPELEMRQRDRPTFRQQSADV